jgi:hypothetical protein
LHGAGDFGGFGVAGLAEDGEQDDPAARREPVGDAGLLGQQVKAQLGREVRLGTGYADLLAVESSGRLVIIEVKLAGNAESRRAVVAQVLSYAGYLQGLDPGQLESQVLATQLAPAGTVVAAVEADDQQYGLDGQAFQDGLARTLAEGSFRLVIVLESAPDELLQVVGYLELVADKIDIDLVTVTAYEANGSRVLVPQRVEPARRARELSSAQLNDRRAGVLYPGSAQFRASIVDAPLDQRGLLERLADWGDALERDGLVRLSTYYGKNGVVTLPPRLASDNAGLVTIYNDNW